MKKCPFCHEEIMNEAVKCRYCGEFLNKEDISTTPQKNQIPQVLQKTKYSWFIKILLFILLAILSSGLAAQATSKKSFPIYIFVLVLVSLALLIIAIRIIGGKKEKSKLLFSISIPLLICSIFFFWSSYTDYKNISNLEKAYLENQNALNLQKEREKQEFLSHIEEHYQQGLLNIKNNKYKDAKSILDKILANDPNYKDVKLQLDDVNQKLVAIEIENKKTEAIKNINEAENLSRSNSCSEIGQAISKCESALLIFPDSEKAKNILQKAKIEKLRCAEGNSEITMSIQIVEYQPLKLHVWIKNLSGVVRHANPNNFTLITVKGRSMSVSTDTYGLSNYFNAVELQPKTETSGSIIFDTYDKPLKLVYQEMLGTIIERVFPFK